MNGETLAILISLVALVVAVVAALRKGGGAADQTMVNYFQQQQAQREQMALLERAYQNSMFQRMFDTMALGAKMVAPLTPFKADDALATWMTDVQTPGKPEDKKGNN